jgi:tetratricopeptide (TPR) repeat protein
MINGKNIHIAILGIILGSGSAYIFGSYQAETRRHVVAQETADTLKEAAANPPEITDEEMLALFDEALRQNPGEPELLMRYGNFLFNLERYQEAIDAYAKVLEGNPNDPVVRTDMGTAFYSLGQVDEAMEAYGLALAADPNHILALHNLAIAQIEAMHDVNAAQGTIQRIEGIAPNFQGLGLLRERLATERDKQ